MDKEIFKDHTDYWQVADNIRDIYMSDGSLTTLLQNRTKYFGDLNGVTNE